MLVQCGGVEVAVTRKKGCRRFILRVRPGEGSVTLTVPWNAGKAETERFLREHDAWLREHAQAMPWQPSFAAGERHLLLGRYETLGEGLPVGEAAVRAARAAALEGVAVPLLSAWSQRMGVRPARLTIREMTSRWGSCALGTGRITLNLRLARVPETLIEQVVVHELCHLHHPDHSPAFYAEMTALLPDWPARKAALDAFDITPRPGS